MAEPRKQEATQQDEAPVAIDSLLRQAYRFALSLTHDPARAEDLLQDAWVSTLRAGGPRTAAYLITAVRTRWGRSGAPGVDRADGVIRRAAAPPERGRGRLLGRSLPCGAAQSALDRALKLLRPEERAVLVLSAVEGYTAREIGELLDAPRGTVLSLMHRTRAKMRRWLEE